MKKRYIFVIALIFAIFVISGCTQDESMLGGGSNAWMIKKWF